MQILNLTNKEASQISYAISHFPDGEVIIKLGDINRKDSVWVICRITNAEELFILMQVGDILNRQGIEWHLNILYLMSMRMDRVIDFNQPFSLNVVANMIKSLNPKEIGVVHPHSKRTLELLHAINTVETHFWLLDGIRNETFQVCFPDNGAFERYQKMYAQSHTPPLIGAKKRNTETGKIESIVITNPEDYKGVPIMIVDDLCDGGGTFLGIAEAIRKIDENAKISISLIHMVNPKGIENLSKTFDNVFFTNSYKDWDNLPENCKMYNIWAMFNRDLL